MLKSESTYMNSKDQEFNTILDRFYPLICKIARSYCKNPDDQQDLIQEIILQLWRSYPKYNDQFAFSTWIYRISLNVSISFYRRSKRRQNIESDQTRIITEMYSGPDEALNEQLAKMYHLLDELGAFDKALMILYLEEKSHSQIADIMGLSKSNVSTKISRLKQELKSKFEKEKNK